MMIPLIILFFAGGNLYLFWRIWQMIPAGNPLRWIAVAAGVLLIASMFVSILAGGSLPSPVTKTLYKAGTAWFFIFIYLLMSFLLLDLLRLCGLRSLNAYMHGSWIGLGVVTGAVTLVMTLGYIRYRHKERVTLTVTTAKPAFGKTPLKIVALSDLHLGYGIGREEFARWVDRINREEPDVVLLAGDVIDNSLRPVREEKMEEVFRNIRSRYGVYAVPGNHEYISGIGPSIGFLRDAGVQVLRDSAALVDGRLWIVGRDDRSNPLRKTLAELTAPLDASIPVILLDHQPYELEKAEEAGVALQFSGHTHRGQVWPISWITDRLYEDSHGLLQKGATQIYVSSGIGIWGGKFRIGTQSEYVVIELRPAE